MNKCGGCARRREWFKKRLEDAKKRLDWHMLTEEEQRIAAYLKVTDDKKD